MRLPEVVGGLIAGAVLLLAAYAAISLKHDEHAEEAAVEEAWPYWLKPLGGKDGK